MRLSATDRIIREAQQHDSAAVAGTDEHPDTDKVSGPPLLSLGFPGPRMPRPLGDVDVSFDDQDDDDDAYEEGETQVDAKRSAAALDQMRALQEEGKLTPPPVLTRRSDRHHGLPPGRPGGSATLGLVPAPTPAPQGFPKTMLIFAAPASRPSAASLKSMPAAATPAPVATPAPMAMPAPAFRQTGGQLDAVRTPTPTPAPRRGRVGRRTGFAIATTTAIAVTVILGSWTDRQSTPAPAVTAGPSSVAAPVVRPVTVAASDSAAGRPSGTVAAAAPPAPAAEPATAPAAITPPAPPIALIPSPAPAAPLPAAATTEDQAPAPVRSTKHAQAAVRAAKIVKARLAKKKALASKKNMRGSRPTRAGGVAAGRSSAGAAARGRSDPDDTLPISY